MEEYRRLILNSDAIEAAENWNDGIVHLADLGDIYIHVSQNKEQTFGISSILDDLEPETIIIFEVNLDILRQIEAYKARRPSLPCKGRFESDVFGISSYTASRWSSQFMALFRYRTYSRPVMQCHL